MRRLNLVLLATLQLCGARSRGFSVYEDLLTFPQVSRSSTMSVPPAPSDNN